MFAGKKSAQIREILISESAWEEMTCLFAPSLAKSRCFYCQVTRFARLAFVHSGFAQRGHNCFSPAFI
ncbi:hypothetical protein GBT17_17645 [Escherichia coli]|nr:hypothetical protein [Escherichia coli]